MKEIESKTNFLDAKTLHLNFYAASCETGQNGSSTPCFLDGNQVLKYYNVDKVRFEKQLTPPPSPSLPWEKSVNENIAQRLL